MSKYMSVDIRKNNIYVNNYHLTLYSKTNDSYNRENTVEICQNLLNAYYKKYFYSQ